MATPGHESYRSFARFYDSVMGDRADHAAYIRTLLGKYAPRARTVLELASGTGSIVKQLEGTYDVTGVDRSPEMLKVARAKVPGARFIEADMTSVELNQKFDVVLCVYDSINHLQQFSEWELVFDRANDHLRDGGVWIFDMNTEYQLKQFASSPAHVRELGNNVMIMDVQPTETGSVDWQITIFEKNEGNTFTRYFESIPEAAFPLERVKEALAKRFKSVRAIDASRSRPTSRSGRVYFVCRR
jgi:SAM-dependent methyltransferase